MAESTSDPLVWALASDPAQLFRVGAGGVIEFVDDAVRARWAEAAREGARLRRNEQLMTDTQGVAHLGIWEWDVSEPTASWTDELYRIYGLTRETYTPSYEAYLTKVHPDDRDRVIEATTRVFREHVPYSHDERIFRPDGTMRYLHTWAHPVLDESGKLVRLVGVCQDITDQKVAEERVSRLNAELEQRVAERTRTIERSLRDVEAFNAMVSHDLRAPLSIITLTCGIIGEGRNRAELPPSVVDGLDRIRHSVEYMTALVNDLLALAHVGNAPLARVDVDLSRLATEVIANLRMREPSRDVSARVAPGLKVVADAALIRRVMENLIGNAWKYSARVPRARIEVERIEVEGKPTFVVSDNGVGFDMALAHQLFVPFQRLHEQTEFEGTGVGLAAVQRILERHGGRIWAESEPNRGARMMFQIP